MRKKLFKYIKLLISTVLILGLVAPSYASLSASDGSAFVTKAEFDSALADFNSRLTTFEAGINSKIDSQVTSYLDRNGIWNGKEIDFEESSVSSDGYFWCELWKDIFSRNGTYTSSSDVKYPTSGVYGTVDVGHWVIGRSSKSGLLYLQMQWFGAGTLADRWWFTVSTAVSATFIDSFLLGTGEISTEGRITWGDNIGKEGKAIEYLIPEEIKASTTLASGTDTDVAAGAYGTPIIVYMFMLKKNDLITGTRTFYSGVNYAGSTLSRRNSWGGEDDKRPHFKILNAQVY